MNSLEKESLFTVRGNFNLSPDEEKVLLRCYLPIITNDGYALYHLFIQMAQNSDYSSTIDLKEKMNGDVAKLNTAVNYLEAMSLVSTYRKGEDNKTYYIYQLKRPLSPKEFFSYKPYLALLNRILGERRVEEIINIFEINKKIPEEFDDVSVSFSDVFDVNPDLDDLSYLSGKALNLMSDEKKVNGKFSYDEFKSELKRLSIDPSIVSMRSKDIEELSNLYAIPSKMAADIIKDVCISTDGRFSFDTFVSSIKNYYHFHIDDEIREADIVELGTSDMAKRIKIYNSIASIEFLGKLLKVDPPKKYRDLLERLHDDFRLSDPIINVLVDYVFQKCDGSIPENYIYPIASSLPSHNFSSANDVVTFLYQNEEKRIDRKNNKEKSYKKYMDKVAKKEKEKETDTKHVEKEKKPADDVDLGTILGDDF